MRHTYSCSIVTLFVLGVATSVSQASGPAGKQSRIPNVTGEWTGEWGPYNPAKGLGLTKEHCKRLDCKVLLKDGVWHATFEGECGRPYKFTINMTGRQVGDVVLFKGTTDLGEKGGGVYDWVGRATEKEFIGFYTSARYAGVFKLFRTGARPKVGAVPDALRQKLKLDPFYEKHTHYKGYPILSSAKVSNAALLEARYLISQMLAGRDDLLQAIIKKNCRFVVMAPTEMTTDVPEQRNMKPKEYWDRRARGLGGRITSCGEENLLNLKGDRYRNENILIHEFAHCIHNYGLRSVDPTFDKRLRSIYARAMDKGLWKKTYAATNAREYWAEAVQSYFDCNAPLGGVHNHVNTRKELEEYDPELFELIEEVFKNSKFRYTRYDKRIPQS